MTALTACPGHHAHRGQVLGCELDIGHPLPHVREVGTESNRELVSWRHDWGRRAAEADALRWMREREAWPPECDSVGVTLARLVAAVVTVVVLIVLVAERGT
jgi:hypothetical protein